MPSPTDKFKHTANSGIPVVATVQVLRDTGVPTLIVDTQQYWPTATGVSFSTYGVDTDDKKIAGTQIDWAAVSNGTNALSSMVRTGGAADAPVPVGYKVQMGPTAEWAESVIEGITTQHNQDGTHNAITATTISATDVITGANGLTINAGSVNVPNSSIDNKAIKIACKFSAHKSSTSPIITTTQKVDFNVKDFDTGNNFDNTTNYRFTVPVGGAGFYLFNTQVWIGSAGMGLAEDCHISLHKNGAVLIDSEKENGSGDTHKGIVPKITKILQVADGDYFEVFAVMGGIYRDIVGNAQTTFFEVIHVSTT